MTLVAGFKRRECDGDTQNYITPNPRSTPVHDAFSVYYIASSSIISEKQATAPILGLVGGGKRCSGGRFRAHVAVVDDEDLTFRLLGETRQLRHLGVRGFAPRTK